MEGSPLEGKRGRKEGRWKGRDMEGKKGGKEDRWKGREMVTFF